MADDRTVPAVCRIFNSPKAECTKDSCLELHICFYFATGSCRFGDKCKRTHLLTSVHNKAVLRTNGWYHDNQHPKILTLLQEKFKPKADRLEEKKTGGLKTPLVCFTYNTLGCVSDDCKNLHLCLDSVMSKCPLGDKCHLEHDLVKGDHNIRVLRSVKLLDTEQQVIADNLKEKYIAMSNQQKKPESEKKGQEPEEKQESAQESKGQDPLSVKHGADKYEPKFRGTPWACIAYNKGGCNKASCPFLHVCFGFVMGNCNKMENCLKEHNIFKGEQNKDVLRKFDLLDAKDVFAKIRKGYEARAAAKAAAIESVDGASGGAAPPPPPPSVPQSPPANLTCSVCFEAFIRATTLGCTHSFCEDCVRRAERQCQPCPLCRAPITNPVRSLVIDDMVVEWFDGQDEETQRAQRQLETERRHAAGVPRPLQPAAVSQPIQPAAISQPIQPAAILQPIQPAAISRPTKVVYVSRPTKVVFVSRPTRPAAAQQPRKPAAAQQPMKPAAAQQPRKPAAAQQPRKPAAAQQPKKAPPAAQPSKRPPAGRGQQPSEIKERTTTVTKVTKSTTTTKVIRR